MSLHIHRFVDLIKATESRGQKDLQMPLRDAKDLHSDITKLLVTLEELRTIQANNSSSWTYRSVRCLRNVGDWFDVVRPSRYGQNGCLEIKMD